MSAEYQPELQLYITMPAVRMLRAALLTLDRTLMQAQKPHLQQQ